MSINHIYCIFIVNKMLLLDITKNKIQCSSCNQNVFFDLIIDIECDWGIHDIIQCPNCQELFSIDKQCQAFQDVLNLLVHTPNLLSEEEKRQYQINPHC